MAAFNYHNAFSRNIGWLTEAEQATLRGKRVAIAGGGGVGGEHIMTLARLGVGAFNISDFDVFEEHNFNRQAGAFISTLGLEKVEVMRSMALDINPELKINTFPMGTTEANVDAFLEGVDLYVDSLDFFALSIRRLVFEKCEQKGIPAITAAPLGIGTAFLCFMPGHMTFEQYFRLADLSEQDQQIRFLIGLSPAMLQRSYLVEPSAANFHQKKGPSIPMGVKLCAGIAGSYALKILLNRGKLTIAPWGIHFDAYKDKLVKTWRPLGNAGVKQRLLFHIAKRVVLKEQ